MGLLIDGIIGPVLETFGVIEVGENGEWTRKEHDTTRKEYQKKEREDKESLWERFAKWFNNAIARLKDRFKRVPTPKERYHALVRKKDPEELQRTITEVTNDLKKSVTEITNTLDKQKKALSTLRNDLRRTRDISKEKLRKISKFEGKVLASNEGYRLWHGDHFPYDDEVEEGVVYVVIGQGDPISYTGPLAGIRQDAYYVWDKTKETPEPIGTTPPKEALIDGNTGEINLKNSLKSYADATRWHLGGLMAYDPSRSYVIYPNTVDDHDGDLFDKIGNL